jgi:hypothetical protein
MTEKEELDNLAQEEYMKEQIAPEDRYCEGCGCLLPADREVFCDKCE